MSNEKELVSKVKGITVEVISGSSKCKFVRFGDASNAKPDSHVVAVGESIEGKIVEIKASTQYKCNIYKVVMYDYKEGDPEYIILPTVDLQQKLESFKVQDGFIIRFDGTKDLKKGKNAMKLFTVGKLTAT